MQADSRIAPCVRCGDFPRSVRYCIGLADRALHLITGTPAGTFSCPSEQRMGILRSSFVVGADGRLVQASYGVKPEDTTPEALAALTA